MKTLVVLITVIFCIVTSVSIAQTPAAFNSAGFTREQIEDNYLKGLNSDVAGLQISSAYFLGEMKSERAVIPLMKMFRSENPNSGQRLMAAWSLMKIGDERGLYLIKCEAEKSDCDYLRCMCEYFYKDYYLKKEGHIR